MKLRSLARWLVIGALAVFAVGLLSGLAFAQDADADAAAVQGQNGSSDGTAQSGDVAGSNVVTVGAGPASTSGSGDSQSQQNGDNTVVIRQSATAKTGDAVAGSQVTGVVGGNATIQNQNSSDGATAISGNATATNTATVNAGPTASAVDGTAQAAQTGDNSAVLFQNADAESGDSLAGSQVTGFVGDALTAQGQNNSDDAFSVSGDADAINDAFVTAGPSATSIELFGVGADAQAGQVGDNDLVLRQAAHAETGDGLAGSVVTGAVGTGDISSSSQNSSDNSFAVSGNAFADNLAIVTAGPSAFADASFGSSTAQASQEGDNDVLVDQESGAISGDALAGSQVAGLVSSETGNLSVQNQNSSDSDTAFSGNADAFNTAFVDSGPVATAVSVFDDAEAQSSQVNGDNDVIVRQSALAETGDALAGSQVTGVVGGSDVTILNQNNSDDSFSISGDALADNLADVAAGPTADADTVFGDAEAQAAQDGDNDVDVVQAAEATTGDALAGSQVTGVVTSGGDVTIQNQNSSDDADATSGNAFAVNDLFAAAGPTATAVSGFGDTTAQAGQNGSTDLFFSQDLVAESGDAVAGSQVAGVVGSSDDSTVAQQNSADAPIAFSGNVDGLNVAAGSLGSTAVADSLFGGTATSQQTGDSDLTALQDLELASGDAVVGGQVVGLVASRTTSGLSPASFGQNADVVGAAGAFTLASGGAIA